MLETSDKQELFTWIEAAETLQVDYYIENITILDPVPNNKNRTKRGWRCSITSTTPKS